MKTIEYCPSCKVSRPILEEMSDNLFYCPCCREFYIRLDNKIEPYIYYRKVDPIVYTSEV